MLLGQASEHIIPKAGGGGGGSNTMTFGILLVIVAGILAYLYSQGMIGGAKSEL